METKPDSRLIVAASDTDADMLYATRIFFGDPFIFLEQNGKRTLVLSDLEIDRAKKTSEGGRVCHVQPARARSAGQSQEGAPLRKGAGAFSAKRGVKRALVPANFPLGFAHEIKRNGIALERRTGFSGRSAKGKQTEEIRHAGARLADHRNRNEARGMEVLKASKPGTGKKLNWSGKT